MEAPAAKPQSVRYMSIAAVVMFVALLLYWIFKDKFKALATATLIHDLDGQQTYWNPAPINDNIFYALDSYLWDDRSGSGCLSAECEIDRQMNVMILLTDQQLTAVWNDWEKRYKTKYKNKTLTEAIETASSFTGFFTAIDFNLLNQLKIKYGTLLAIR